MQWGYVILMCTVILSAAAEVDQYGMDKDLFQKLKDEMKKKHPNYDFFMKKIWPKMVDSGVFLNSDVILPGVAVKSKKVENQYICATKAKGSPKLGSIVQPWYGKLAGWMGFGKGWQTLYDGNYKKEVFKVNVHLNLDQPFEAELARKTGDTVDIPKIPIKFKFIGKSVVSMNFVIPDFSEDVSSSKCLVTLQSIFVVELGGPIIPDTSQFKKDENKQKMVTEFVGKMRPAYLDALTGGIMTAVKEKLTGESWICASKAFAEEANNFSGDDKYIKNYNSYCSGLVEN